MAKIILAPSKYVQGENQLENLGLHLKSLGNKIIVMIDSFVLNLLGERLIKSLKGLDYHIEIFGGESSLPEINKYVELVKKFNYQVIVGIGGGKAADACKAVAHFAKIKVAVVPSIASTSASCSKLSVIYTPEGEFLEYLHLDFNPQLVLVDTRLIAKAPQRLFIAGVGDAMATYFETRACAKSGAKNFSGGTSSQTSLGMALLCKNLLLQHATKAMQAVAKGIVTPDLENVIEASLYLSTIGTESGGLAAAHAIHNGFTHIKECEHIYHGEKVAFCILVQLALEQIGDEESIELIKFFKSMKLPYTLEQMGINNISSEQLDIVAQQSTKSYETIHNMPFKVNADMVKKAILKADTLGKKYK